MGLFGHGGTVLTVLRRGDPGREVAVFRFEDFARANRRAGHRAALQIDDAALDRHIVFRQPDRQPGRVEQLAVLVECGGPSETKTLGCRDHLRPGPRLLLFRIGEIAFRHGETEPALGVCRPLDLGASGALIRQ